MIVVTGGAGFIGSVLVKQLNKSGHKNIIIVDALRKKDKWKNLRNKQYANLIHKNDFLQQINNFDIEAIIHLGACSATTELDADYLLENNYHYSRFLLEYSLKNNIRFITASSAATYGDGENGFSDDDSLINKLTPLNMYGYSKQMLDEYIVNNNCQNKVVSLKFFNVFGPNEYHKGNMMSVVNKAYYQVKNTGKVKLFKSYHPDYTDGDQLRDFVYVKDVVKIIEQLVNKPEINGIFNIGTGQANSWNSLVKAVFKALNKPVNIEYIEMPEELKGRYQYYTCAEMAKLKSKLEIDFLTLENSVKDYVVNHLEKENIYY